MDRRLIGSKRAFLPYDLPLRTASPDRHRPKARQAWPSMTFPQGEPTVSSKGKEDRTGIWSQPLPCSPGQRRDEINMATSNGMMTYSEESSSATSATSGTDLEPVRFCFANTYARLPERFYARLNPTPVVAPRLIKLNADLSLVLGLDPGVLASPEGVEILAGNRIAAGSEPLAIAYAGHQFGAFVPQLGDGRANLLGEVIGRDGVRYDVQLKGSGPTPFSRGGDGRAALGPVLREYILSEAMAALGVPTTRALAAVTTGERVFRETPEQGAVLTRVARSHVRIGTFEFFANRGDAEGVRALADYVIARHYPEVAEAKQPYRALLDAVIGRVAVLVAHWLHISF